MITINFETNKGRARVQYPTSWDEITLAQLIKLHEVKKDDPVGMFSVLSGIKIDELEESAEDNLDEVIYSAIAFLYSEPDWENLDRPTKVLIGAKVVEVPTRLDLETLGQKILFDQAAAKSANLLEVIPECLAIYFQPAFDGGKFDRDRVEKVRRLILKAPATAMYAVAAFFLRNRKNLRRLGMFGSHLLARTRREPQKSSQELTS